MDILLVNSNFGGDFQGIPLGVLTLASILEEKGFSVDFRDYQVASLPRKPDPATFSSFLTTSSPIIGISVMAPSLPTVLCAVKAYKEHHPEKTIILGGPSATDTPREILEAFPVDIVVTGEGETTISNLMEALTEDRPLKDVEGIHYREKGKIHSNKRPPRIKDLDDIPFPAYHFIDFSLYDKKAILLTARGCPYACAFCSAHSIWERTLTYRSVKNVIEELTLVSDRIERFVFADDIFMLNPRRVIRLCEELRSRKVDLPWSCNGRVNHISRDLIMTMTSAGLSAILYGIESGSNRVLEEICKEFTIEKARQAVSLTTEYVDAETSYIWGFPFETMDDFFETIFCVVSDRENPRITPQLIFLNPLSQSPLFTQYKATLSFSPALTPGISRLPGNERLTDYPELIEAISSCPQLFSSYWYYNHDTLPEKCAYIQNLSERG